MAEGAGSRALVMVAGVGVLLVGLVALGGWYAVSAATSDPRTSAAPTGDELLVNVEQIRQAELTLKDVFGAYTACGSRDAATASVSDAPRAWTSAPCWVTVGWQPDTMVRGGYWVEVGGDGFVVYGVDPEGREVRATAAEPAKLHR